MRSLGLFDKKLEAWYNTPFKHFVYMDEFIVNKEMCDTLIAGYLLNNIFNIVGKNVAFNVEDVVAIVV